jgi:heme iron utilization protein
VTPEDREALRALFEGQRLLALGVVVDGEPVVGILPYAVSKDRAAVYIQASRLARHTRGLLPGGRWGGAIHRPDAPEDDPLQVPRLTLEGSLEPLARDAAEFEAAARAFLERFPSAAMTLSLGDFGLYRLEVEGGRLVLGFGRALNVSRSHFEDLAKP